MHYFNYGHKGCSNCGGKGYTEESWCPHLRCSLCQSRTEAMKARLAKRISPVVSKIERSKR